MRGYERAYAGAILVVALGTVLGAVGFPESDFIAASLGHWVLAALSFPLGLPASAVGLLLIYLGLLTPTEAVVAMAPVFGVLGYVQWFRVLPRVYGGRREG